MVAEFHWFPWLPDFSKTFPPPPPLIKKVTVSFPVLLPYMWYMNFSVLDVPRATSFEASAALFPGLRGQDVSMYM